MSRWAPPGPASIIFRKVPQPRRTPPKSKYTSDRLIPGAFEGETVTRRRLMGLTVQGAGAVAVMGFTLPALGFAIGSAVFERPPATWEAVGPTDDFPDDTYVPKVITTVQGIGEVGKTTVYIRAYNPEIDGEKDTSIPGGGDFIALSTRCMHLGCPVRFVEASERFICPCHGGVYDFTGQVDGGPPVRPLDRFYTRVQADQVEIGPRFSVNSEFERFPSYRDPGQDLDGIGQYLYPGRFSTPKLD
jgi:menaquinol-cytochrome c reductase iron-sulfur subunit